MSSGNNFGERSREQRVLRSLLPIGLVGLVACLVLLAIGALTGFQDVEQWRLTAIVNFVLAFTLVIIGLRARRSR